MGHDPRGFMHKDEVQAYLQGFCERNALPVRFEEGAHAVSRAWLG